MRCGRAFECGCYCWPGSDDEIAHTFAHTCPECETPPRLVFEWVEWSIWDRVYQASSCPHSNKLFLNASLKHISTQQLFPARLPRATPNTGQATRPISSGIYSRVRCIPLPLSLYLTAGYCVMALSTIATLAAARNNTARRSPWHQTYSSTASHASPQPLLPHVTLPTIAAARS